MSTAIVKRTEAYETALIRGDLKDLTTDERLSYYKQVCDSLGLNPLTKPFEFISLNGKLTLYARKDATDQIRRANGVSVDSVQHDFRPELQLYIVTANGHDKHGRHDASTGAVPIAQGLKGEALANQIMKAETKAKRRLTLSLCGLGMLDETEVESIPNALPMGACVDCGDEIAGTEVKCPACKTKKTVPQLTEGSAGEPEVKNQPVSGGSANVATDAAATLSELRSKVIKQKQEKGKVFWELEGKVLLWHETKDESPNIVGRTIECTAKHEGLKRGFQTFQLVELVHISQAPEASLEIQEQDLVPVLEASIRQVAEKKKLAEVPKQIVPADDEPLPF